jgi:predicted naringenin-chalcone synthase
MGRAYLNRIGTAVPENDVHAAFIEFAEKMLADERTRTLFLRMAAKSEIQSRYSCLKVTPPFKGGDVDAYKFYERGSFPSTESRMQLFERAAPVLAGRALDDLAPTAAERKSIKHVLVTCCTGLYAPGLDFEVIDHLGLSTATERTMVGFMGCYAAINALKLARHIVRSEPGESVLLLNLELCTLHFHESQELGEVLSFLVFGDGCTASLISSDPIGLELESFQAIQIDGTRDLITWRIGDLGFDMQLSGRVPGEISKALHRNGAMFDGKDSVDLWAVHPGGRSVLDAVEEGLALPPKALLASRSILSRFGNMSSATIMFVLQELMKQPISGKSGCAMSFGPGLTAETMRFHGV